MNIYLDNNATTAIDPQVKQSMIQAMDLGPLNPSSIHKQGQLAKSLLTSSRHTIANFFNVSTKSIIFTSTATEALNWLINFFAASAKHIISSKIEHAAVYENIHLLAKTHDGITFIPVKEEGNLNPELIKQAITPETDLIIISAVNSETGVMNDIDEIATIAKQHNIPLIVDAVAWLGKSPIHISDGISAMVFSSHKIHGPQGIAAFYIHPKIKLTPLFFGGSQEFSLRGGTENIIGVVGFAKAIEILAENEKKIENTINELRLLFERKLKEFQPSILINGTGKRISNVTNLYFPNVDAETLLIALDQQGICASHGSACSSGSLQPSRTLLEMGLPYERAKQSIRFSFSRMNTQDEIIKSSEIIAKTYAKLLKIELR